jgi:nitrogen-specific signal transduction histidine kinase/CheY-like chemotaxis protein
MPFNLGPYFWFIGITLILAAVTNTIYKRYKKAMIDEKTLAIAQTTQMLAHDVRKPFALLETLLRILKSTHDPAMLREVAEKHVPSVQRALSLVNGMIDDIVEISRNQTLLDLQPTSLETIIEASLSEVGRMFPESAIPLRYHFEHKKLVHIDSLKLQRVFSNIITNAFQAIRKTDGVIWFSTQEYQIERNAVIEVTIGNSGSYIAEDDIGRIFDVFYTKNKSQGTGLGLAIAQKIVALHGGSIWCRSSKALNSVEFKFTLPASPTKTTRMPPSLPHNSSEIVRAWDQYEFGRADTSFAQENMADDVVPTDLEDKIEQLVLQLGRPLAVWFVDDESLYLSSLKRFIERCPRLDGILQFRLLPEYQEAIDLYDNKEICDVLITDIDLGLSKLDGFSLIRSLRAKGFAGPVCVHSNRHDIADLQKPGDNFDSCVFIPKPMTRIHLLKFLASVKLCRDGKGAENKEERTTMMRLENSRILGLGDGITGSV